jgi:hypothetical protein
VESRLEPHDQRPHSTYVDDSSFVLGSCVTFVVRTRESLGIATTGDEKERYSSSD